MQERLASIFFLSFMTLLIHSSKAGLRIEFIGNKKEFQQGESVVFHARIHNQTDSVVGLCWNSSFDIYSFTYGRPGEKLLHFSDTGLLNDDSAIRYCYSHPPVYEFYDISPAYCRLCSNESVVIEPGQVLDYPMLVNECPDLENCACLGKYRHLLPRGDYAFRAKFVFANGRAYEAQYRFAIIAPDAEWRQKLNVFGNFVERLYSGYTREQRDSLLFDYFQQCDDSRLASKIILRYWESNIDWQRKGRMLTKADTWLVYLILNREAFVFPEGYWYSYDKKDPEYYRVMFRQMKPYQRVYSEYLKERLAVIARHWDSAYRNRLSLPPVTEYQLQRVKIYSVKK